MAVRGETRADSKRGDLVRAKLAGTPSIISARVQYGFRRKNETPLVEEVSWQNEFSGLGKTIRERQGEDEYMLIQGDP